MPRLRWWCSQGQASSISPQGQPGQRAKKAKWGGQGAWLPWCQTIQRGPVRVLPRYTDGARTLLWYQNPAGRDGKWSTQFGKKNYRQNSSFKDGTGGLKTSDQAPCSSEPHHVYLVSWQTGIICCALMKSASCVPGHVSHFIDYLKLSLLFSCTRAIT